MKITVFTSNQPRHISLIKSLAVIADEVFAVQECNTVFPGQVEDFFKKSDVMQNYFENVMRAEKEVFGLPMFLPSNVQSLSLKSGDLNKLNMEILKPALKSDFYIVFGSSFIKGELIDFLVSKRAINIHMGLSPFYRGSSCNFWALYDDKPDYVGATIHLLSKGLDSGAMLLHAVPKAEEIEPFLLGMYAVKVAHNGLINAIKTGEILKMEAIPQDKALEIRYTRNKDFTDEVASRYLAKQPTAQDIFQSLRNRDLSILLNPYIE
ncbi:Formyl transferase [Ectothiorhodospira magna]|uniref:Formyl transferase n=1 Tax=Ectothiorhodospira magna TaxID=867345 RepID=A0A1H9GQN9_9GAMM|nr:formyltransferase family protein [Ectothiorhodospira magna]SEQ52370.1 Formyl transferase [Ectothiorhodospira magna]